MNKRNPSPEDELRRMLSTPPRPHATRAQIERQKQKLDALAAKAKAVRERAKAVREKAKKLAK